MQVFTNQVTDADSPTFKHFGENGDYALLNVYIAGTFGGGTVSVQAQLPDGSGWVTVGGGDITVAGMHVIDAGPFVGRLHLAGATSPSINAWVESDSTAVRDRVAAAT